METFDLDDFTITDPPRRVLEGTERRETFSSESESDSEEVFIDSDSSGSRWKALSVVLGSFFGLVPVFGIINSLGAIQTYVSTHQLADVNGSTTSWIFSIYYAICFACGIFVGPFFDRNGSLVLLLMGSIISFGGYMALSYCKETYQFILALSICVAFGNALCMPPLIGVLNQWFDSHRGIATGFATLGGSVGGMIIPVMLRSLFQRVGYGWAIRALGFLSFGCLLLATILARERNTTSKFVNIRHQGFRLGDIFKALKDVKYVLMIGGTVTSELALLLLGTYYSTYAIAQGMSESSSYVLLTIFNALGLAGRLVPGFLSDKVGPLNIMIIMLTCMSLSMLLLWVPFGHNLNVLFAFAAIAGFFTSSVFSLTSVCLASITRVDQFGARYGLLYFFVSFIDLFGIPLGSVVIGKGTNHEYDMFALLCGFISLTGTILWIASRYCIVGFTFNVRV